MINAFLISLKTGTGENLSWAGFSNYARLLKDNNLITALKNTVTFMLWQLPIMLTLALVFAAVLNQKDLKFKGLFQTLLFIPCTMALVSYSIIFKLLFMTNGLINKMLVNAGILETGFNFLGDPTGARFVLIFALIWRWTGYNMIFYLSGLSNIDETIYEAAQIDGASAFQRFTKITIPMLKPIILLTIIMSTNGNLQLFDECYNLTRGGPGISTMSISQYIYKVAFQSVPNFGYASTIGFVLMILIAALVLLQLKVGDKRE